MAATRLAPRQGTMGIGIGDIPAFPGEGFGLTVPESIGDAARTVWFGPRIRPDWRALDDGAFACTVRVEGELRYTATVAPHEDAVDVRISLTNESDRDWAQSCAFTCFQCGGSPSVNDHECVRHWVRTGGQFKRLIEIPRRFGPRPTVQLYSVEGAPPGMSIPFVANFQATPDVAVEGWLAIASRDGRRLAAVASKPALFLFQNMEYSCIHSCPGFGALKPGETGEALTKACFVEGTVQDWHERVQKDLA